MLFFWSLHPYSVGAYFATLDGFGQASVHDVLLHPRRPDGSPNNLPGALSAPVRAALEDLFLRARGPALRATYAHGNVPLDGGGGGGGGGACVRLMLAAMVRRCRLNTSG